MCQRTVFSRSCRRLAEEAQLIAEQQFMKHALKVIKSQRNSLQIERLHLDSLKQQLLNPKKTKIEKKSKTPEPGTSKEGVSNEAMSNEAMINEAIINEAMSNEGMSIEDSIKGTAHPNLKTTEMMSVMDMMTLGSKLHKDDFIDDFDADLLCNNQELNLNLSFDAHASGAGTSNDTYPRQFDYNSEEDPSSDESDGDNVMIDMNMLMNGTTSSK